MYLLDDRFCTAVAFVEGFNQAQDGGPLDGFQEWVSSRILGRRAGISWAYIIASTRVPRILEGGLGIDSVPADADIELINLMLDLLEEFDDSRPPAMD